MLRLNPPVHSVPDNFWYTILISMVASFFIWQTGQELVELILMKGPVTLIEQRLLEEEGHPIQLWIVSLAGEGNPLLWNRILALSGWIFTLGLILKSIKQQSGFVGGLPSVLLLFVFPGFSAWMSSAGSGSWGIYFFLKGFYMVTGNETKAPLIRGGVLVALAVLIHPIWILPSLGVFVGCWEAFRYRLKWVATGFAAMWVPGLLLFLLLAADGLGYVWMGPASASGMTLPWGELLIRHMFLAVILLLLVVYGALRRGVGWWTLVLSLPLLMLEPFLASGMETAMIPLWVFTAIGLAKLPVVLDIRFPRMYQTVLLCQLLLWMPVMLDLRPIYLYPLLP
ncbi:hypothetical protein P0Y35_10360 [Kiritimatiellaeota bacterium B1221]|nr:hypothetical protein [Kiritimatiellaeota bacterium B1221]